MKKLTLIVAFVILATSCQKILDSATTVGDESVKATDLVKKTVGEYSISVPKYMKEMKSLHDEASFEYANIFKETYTVIIDESKQEFIDAFKNLDLYDDSKTALQNYEDIQLQSFDETVTNFSSTKNEAIAAINNLPASQYVFEGSVDGIDIGYVTTFIESEGKMYMIMSWTLRNRFKTYKKTFKLIADSFTLN